jgi:transmembrane sensor
MSMPDSRLFLAEPLMHDHAEEAAARWALRHPLDAAQRTELEAWLAQDRRHRGALLRAMAGLRAVERALDPTNTGAADEPRPAIARPGRRRLLMTAGGAIAASALGIVAWPYVSMRHVETSIGEIRRLPLDDGSVALINTDSELRVRFAQDVRRVSLERGQAWFRVSKDRTRPFIVDAGLAKARAVGTAFSVQRGTDGVQIAVTEGVVAVWPSGASGAMTILNAGQFANIRFDEAVAETGTAPAEIERSLAWRSGEISLEGETLASAVEQFNRYNHQKLVIADRGLADKRLVGLFKIDRPGDFASTLAVSLDLKVTSTPTAIRLAQKDPVAE